MSALYTAIIFLFIPVRKLLNLQHRYLIIPLISIFLAFVFSILLNMQYLSTRKGVTQNYGSGVGVYLINLDHSQQRYNYVMPKIKALNIVGMQPIVRVPAIDGNTLSEQDISQVIDLEKYLSFLGHYPKKGTIGCYLSHVTVWHIFLKSNNEFALIFEDDVDFDAALLSNAINVLQNDKIKSLWDIALFEILHRGTPLAISKVGISNLNLALYLTKVTHAGAYIINRYAAKKLLDTALPILMPIDHYMTRGWELGVVLTGIEPRIVYQRYGDSEINNTTYVNKSSDVTQLKLSIRRVIYECQSAVMRLLYNLAAYINSIYML